MPEQAGGVTYYLDRDFESIHKAYSITSFAPKLVAREDWPALHAIADRSTVSGQAVNVEEYRASHEHPNLCAPEHFNPGQLVSAPLFTQARDNKGDIAAAMYDSWNTSRSKEFFPNRFKEATSLGRRALSTTISLANKIVKPFTPYIKMTGYPQGRRYRAIRELDVAEAVGPLIPYDDEKLVIVNGLAAAILLHRMRGLQNIGPMYSDQTVTAYYQRNVREHVPTAHFMAAMGFTEAEGASQDDPTVRLTATVGHIIRTVQGLQVYSPSIR